MKNIESKLNALLKVAVDNQAILDVLIQELAIVKSKQNGTTDIIELNKLNDNINLASDRIFNKLSSIKFDS